MRCQVNEDADGAAGKKQIDWAFKEMPVLASIRERFERERPLEGTNVSGCLHITAETANLGVTLKAGGARVALCASNPLSTNDAIALSLAEDHGISVFAKRGVGEDTYYRHVDLALDNEPHITMDDGGDLVSTIHQDRRELLAEIIGGTEETTTGVKRFRNMEREGALEYPIIAVNDAYTKHLFDNRYGTGQSTIDGIIRATNVLLAGKKVVVAGYGWCGRGIAMRARGMGARVIVTEVDPVRALEASMDGFDVRSMEEAAGAGDIFVTATGNTSVIRKEHLEKIRDGAILANSGHFNVEIDAEALREMSVERKRFRSDIEEYSLKDGRKVYLLSQGRLVNLAAAEGHPPSVMDMSFADQALCAEYFIKHPGEFEVGVHNVPREIDRKVARLKLLSMGIRIDELTREQREYLGSWKLGT